MNKGKTILIVLGYLLIYVGSVLVTMFIFRSLFANEGFRQFYEHNPVSMLVVSNAITLPIFYMIFKVRGKSMFQFCQFRRLNARIGWLTVPLGISLGTLIYTFSALPLVTTYLPDISILTFMIGNGGSFFIVLLGSVLLGSLTEEIVFRGLMIGTMQRVYSMSTAIVVQALLFGVLTVNVSVGIYAALGAALFGVIFVWSGSLWASIIVHMISTSTIFLFFQIHGLLTETAGYVLLTLSIIILIVFLWLLKRSKSSSLERSKLNRGQVISSIFQL